MDTIEDFENFCERYFKRDSEILIDDWSKELNDRIKELEEQSKPENREKRHREMRERYLARWKAKPLKEKAYIYFFVNHPLPRYKIILWVVLTNLFTSLFLYNVLV